MDRTLLMAAIVFAALAIVGIWMTIAPAAIATTSGGADAFRTLGGAMFAAGLAAFLVEAFEWSRRRQER